MKDNDWDEDSGHEGKDKGGDGTRAGHRFETIVILTDCLTDYRFFFLRSDLVKI